MNTVAVARITEDQAITRRTQILVEIGDVEAFRARAHDYLLDVREQALFNELEDLDYLLAL